jgi:hypothetical protein
MRATRVLALLSVIGLAMAANGSIKQRLAQQGVKNLAQVQVDAEGGPVSSPGCGCGPALPFNWDLPEREPDACTCTADEIENLGAPVSHSVNATTTHLSSTQDAVLASVPDSQFTGTETHTCCSCENAVHDAYQNATKIRHFSINGDICVTESIEYAESQIAEEASVGESHENFAHTETAVDAGLGADA